VDRWGSPVGITRLDASARRSRRLGLVASSDLARSRCHLPIDGTLLGFGESPVDRRDAHPQPLGNFGPLQANAIEPDHLLGLGACRGLPIFVFPVSPRLGHAEFGDAASMVFFSFPVGARVSILWPPMLSMIRPTPGRSRSSTIRRRSVVLLARRSGRQVTTVSPRRTKRRASFSRSRCATQKPAPKRFPRSRPPSGRRFGHPSRLVGRKLMFSRSPP
jgi:hypothetical protein